MSAKGSPHARAAPTAARGQRAGTSATGGWATRWSRRSIVLLLAITAYPLLYNLWNSFHFDNLSYADLPHKCVGFWTNFTLLFSVVRLGAALERTLVFTGVTIVFDIVVALAWR